MLTDMVNVGGGDNWDASFAGSGPLDSVAQVVKSIQSNDGLSIGVNGAVAALDLLGALESPFKTIAGSAVGWLIEHVLFLDWFLDHTAGDPVALEAAVGTLQNAAKELDTLAGEHLDALSQVPTYVEGGSGSFNAFFGTVAPRAQAIKARSMACVGQSSGMMLAAGTVSATRGIIRDALAEFVLFLFERGAEALAAAPYTGGASIGLAVQDVALRAVHTATDLADELGRLTQKLIKVSLDLGTLQEAVLLVGRNVLPALAKTADMSAEAPEYHEADEAKARREPPEPPPATKPSFPWRVQGTLDEQ
jgi:hypothetical protein